MSDEQRWLEIEAAYERLQRADPSGWQDYLDELFEVNAGEADTGAGEEWPEHNRIPTTSRSQTTVD